MRRYYSQLIEKNSHILLMLILLFGMLFDDKTDIGNYIYCVAIIAPMFLYLLLNPGQIAHMAKHRGVQLFLIFLTYSVISIAWSHSEYPLIKILLRCLGVFAVLMICYLSMHYHSTKLPLIERVFLIGGALCLILASYQHESGFSFRHVKFGHGVFNHHVYISWLAGTLLLLLLAKKSRLSIAECALFCFFVACIILSAGRGGLIVFVAGYLCMIFTQEPRYREKQVMLCLIIPAVLVFVLNPHDLLKLVNKGASSRAQIFQVHFDKATDSATHMLIGRGLNSDTDLKIGEKIIPHFHSLYLTLIYKGGIVSLLLYLALLVYVIYQGLRNTNRQPWLFIIIGMSAALAVDASDFFVWPSALMTCFIIPLFLTLFSIPSNDVNNENAVAATTG